MKIIKKISALRKELHKAMLQDKTIGFVPTMGALHAGHISLIRRARKDNDKVVVSIFVNPLQFAPYEDFRKYPRTFKEDIQTCAKEKVDIIFNPDAKEMYKKNHKTYCHVEDLSEVLCGKFRPGHFKGVATVVAKLFNIVQPTSAYFGQKDAQQAVIVKKMTEDLNMPVEIKMLPTVREKSGLALSSRNAYLSEAEREEALVIYEALDLAKRLVKNGHYKSGVVISKMKRLISRNRNIRIQYILIVDLKDLRPVYKTKPGVLIAIAALIGKTRLIDNIIVGRDGSRAKVRTVP